jgi:hypothetical protein
MGAFTEHCIECNAGADAGFNHRLHDSGDGFLAGAAGSSHGVVESFDDSGVGHVWDGGGTPRLRCPNCTPPVTAWPSLQWAVHQPLHSQQATHRRPGAPQPISNGLLRPSIGPPPLGALLAALRGPQQQQQGQQQQRQQ